MNGKSLIFILFCFFASNLSAQVTTYFYGHNKVESKNETAALYSVSIYNNNTRVTVELIPKKNRTRMNYWSSRNTVIVIDGNLELPIIGFMHKKDGKDIIDTDPFTGNWGWNNVKKDEKYYYTMVFAGRIPPGVTTFNLVDRGDYNGSHGYGFQNYTLNNPRIDATSWTESSIKKYCDDNNDGICGIYEESGANGNEYKLGCVKINGDYTLIYLGSKTRMSWWKIGDIKAVLRPSATNGVFKADWYMVDKQINSDVHIFFDGISMKTIIQYDDTFINSATSESFYLKMYPPSSGISSNESQTPIESAVWSGTGFALSNGYLVTNYHVIEGARSIIVKGIKGAFNTGYNAKVVATDKYNDLALLKINDSRFSGFGTIPYKVQTNASDVGEEIFVLGYPLTNTMGDEIKLTTGVISSKTGFQGDVSCYQISAPVQPGNSGGPLFDSKGNIIGVVSSKHTGAENVGYAIKASYLKNLVESTTSSSIIPANNTISGQPLTGKVKSVKNYVFMIECSTQDSYHNPYPFVTNANEDVLFSKSFQNAVNENSSFRWELIRIECSATDTKLIKRVIPKINNARVSSSRQSYIEDVETGNKYYLTSSTIACVPETTAINNELIFIETYQMLPQEVKTINIWARTFYFVENYKIR